MSKALQFKTHRPADRSDPGFTIVGHKLRWVSGKVTEISPGRPWEIISKQNLSPEMQAHLKKFNPNAFAQGETIRRGDLVLAYCPNDVYEALQLENREKAKEQEAMVKRPAISSKSGKSNVTVTDDETTDVTAQMIEKFKKPREE